MKPIHAASLLFLALLCSQAPHAHSSEPRNRDRTSSLFLALDMLEVVKYGKTGMVESIHPEELNNTNSTYFTTITKLKSKEKWEITGAYQYISREIIRIFHEDDLQGHDNCIDLPSIDKQELYAILSPLNKNTKKDEFLRIITLASNEIDNGLLNFKEGFEISFNNTYENSPICRPQNNKITKQAPKQIDEECPLSAQSYQDLFKSKRRINDFKCFQRALEREL